MTTAKVDGPTPGPWKVFPHYCKDDPEPGPYSQTWLIGLGQYDTIAEVRPGHDQFDSQNDANARLIAAAPDLLAALQAINAMPYYDKPVPPEWVEGLRARFNKALDLADAAIAKAALTRALAQEGK